MTYTFDSSVAADATIDAHQRLIATAVSLALPAGVLAAIVMIGGYGRAEGGYVVATDGSHQPYNDYDYFLVFDGVSRARARDLVHSLPHLDDQVGIEVDFHPLLKSDLAGLEFSLMNAEMQAGHRVIWGDLNILDMMPAMPLDQVPLAEFSRMMSNRGCLLLMNYLAPENAVIGKYINKNYLAIGDAQLALAGEYSLHYSRKIQAIAKLDIAPQLMTDYRRAVDLRFRPDAHALWQFQDMSRVTEQWLDTFARLESSRLGQQVCADNDCAGALNWQAYGAARVGKGQGCNNPVKNLLRHLLNPRLSVVSSFALRHPRERIVSELPLLLDQIGRDGQCRFDPAWQARAKSLLAQWAEYS
ncbi:MAG: hypothetical protein NWS96_05355 [Pseudomonadales bacterium]|nr:hypothetical protein [Pseudomonadales bacterium]MDP4640860.1 hypothetical protein [Pseudomonadales bacterium]